MPQSLSPIFTNGLIFSNVCEYLTISDILILSQLSKRVRYIIQNICKSILESNELPLIQAKSPIRQMRFYFDRGISIYKKDDSKDILIGSVQRLLKFKVIKFFQMGLHFTVFLTNNHTAYILRTSNFLEGYNQEFVVRRQIKSIQCKGQKLLYLTLNGEVYLAGYSKGPELLKEETLQPWSTIIKIADIYASFTFAVLVPKTKNNKVFMEQCLLGNLQSQLNDQNANQYSLFLICINFHNGIFLADSDSESIISCAIGQKQIYYVNNRYECYFINLQNIKNNAKNIFSCLYEPLHGKRITKVFSGYSYFYALQQYVQNIQQWDAQRVAHWLREINLGDFAKIALAEKLNGPKLLNMDKKYMENVLGITKLNMQNKLAMSLQEIMGKKLRQEALYSWGKNQYGQLGSSAANYVNYPQRLKLDCLKERQYIDTVFCGWHQTFIRSQKGRIYHSIINTERRKTKKEKHESQTEDLQKNQLQKLKNRKRKNTEDLRGKQKNKKNKKYEGEMSMVESEMGKAFNVQTFKHYTCYLQCAAQQKFEPQKHKKLRTAKTILDRIFWDPNFCVEDFKIGYIDKNMGLIQVSAQELQSYDVKENSIRYIKKNNFTVWDRQNKINYLIENKE